MKKLAVLVMILALVLLTAAMVSADWYYLWGVRGEYAMLATGNCLHSTSGFDQVNGVYRPKSESTVWSGSTIGEGIWTFNGDGTGTAAVTNYTIIPPPDPDPRVFTTKTPPVDNQTFPFTYGVASDGKITVHAPAIGLPLLEGWVSLDLGHKTMTLRSANQIQAPGGGPANL
jgi:hypothetical protein